MRNPLESFWPEKWPTKKQWKRFLEVLNPKEKILLSLLVILTLTSFTYGVVAFYNNVTEVFPARGGIYREGFVLSTRSVMINPIYYSQSNIERDMIEVSFDSLMTVNSEGKLVPRIAKEYKTEDNQVFDVFLREDVYWSDGVRMSGEDVVFTVKTIQNMDFQSTLRPQWEGVAVELVSPYQLRFTLESPSSVFKDNLTLKPIPYHVFGDDTPRELRDSMYNQHVVGSGAYRFLERKESADGYIEYIKMERNPFYYRSQGYLDEVHFYFFRDLDELLTAQERGEIDGFAIPERARYNFPYEKLRNFETLLSPLPRYFSAIFNFQIDSMVSDKDVRRALLYATDKEQILDIALEGKGFVVNSPNLPDFYNIPSSAEHTYDLEKAKAILKEAGFDNGKREQQKPFVFEEDLRENSQGEDVRNLQRCFLHLREEDGNLYPGGEVTGFFDDKTKNAVIYFQEKYREDILDPNNFSKGTGMVAGSTNDKLNELCKGLFNSEVYLELTITVVDEPYLVATARELKRQWELIGIKAEVRAIDSLTLREEIIRPRNFEVLIFGTMLSSTANPLPFWHSTNIDDPGLNLSGYENKDVDEILEKLVKNEGDREELLLEFEELILEDNPSIFLFSPHLVHFIKDNYKGVEQKSLINSSLRFNNIDQWFVKTRRVFNR